MGSPRRSIFGGEEAAFEAVTSTLCLRNPRRNRTWMEPAGHGPRAGQESGFLADAPPDRRPARRVPGSPGTATRGSPRQRL